MSKTPDQFSMLVPDEAEPVRHMPDHLEVVEYGPAKKRPAKALGGGAYNPYERDIGSVGDTARIRRPRVDLRQLSEWIKTTQSVQTLREEDMQVDPVPPPQRYR
jgi:hypothetical protein